MTEFNLVSRTMNVDFIYFDLMLVTIWIAALLIRKRYRQILFGLFGYAVVFFSDYVLWYKIQETRKINAPMSAEIFLAYFSFTYGMIMFSFATIAIDKEISLKEKLIWGAGMYIGWLAIAFLSQWISIDDRVIQISRDMTNARLSQILMAVIGYLIVIALKLFKIKPYCEYSWLYIFLLFVVGCYIHFSMESTLLFAKIRPPEWGVLLVDTLIEFNSGIPILFLMWNTIKLLKKEN